MNHNEVDATFVALYGAEQADTPVVLGLILGSSFGWCIVTEGEITESGWYPTTIKGEGGGMHLLRFKTYLTSIINEYKPAQSSTRQCRSKRVGAGDYPATNRHLGARAHGPESAVWRGSCFYSQEVRNR